MHNNRQVYYNVGDTLSSLLTLVHFQFKHFGLKMKRIKKKIKIFGHALIHSWQLSDPPTQSNTLLRCFTPLSPPLITNAARCLVVISASHHIHTLHPLPPSLFLSATGSPPYSIHHPTAVCTPPSPCPPLSPQESHSNRQDQFSANWTSGNCSSFLIWCWTAVKTRDLPLSLTQVWR